ncbi:hypothetical protein RJ641_009235 [Dillenia turbinata]|uniref:RING-type domain-containing protein n=1 Tax=Dillenia turbinata TaxID=194707 RepID=A0AAN8V1Q2_9MAGN
MNGVNERNNRNLETRERRGEENENKNGSIMIQHDSDSEMSPTNSPTSCLLGNSDSRKSYQGSSSSSIASSSGGCCSGSITEEDEEDDGCLDDWEAVADALAADDKQPQHKPHTEQREVVVDNTVPLTELENEELGLGVEIPKQGNLGVGQRGTRAWSPDDVLRPQSLPNLSKQNSFPMNADRRCGGGVGVVPWASFSAPSSCPICYEDLDLTDTSFLPCLCGFRLCLFCHKRILEEDGRCPGCRKPYAPIDGDAGSAGGNGSGNIMFRLARSCSLITRRCMWNIIPVK